MPDPLRVKLVSESASGLASTSISPPGATPILFGPSFAVVSLSLQLLSTCAADMGSKWVR